MEKEILHGIKCVEHDEITNGGQGRVIEKNPLLIIYLSLDRCDIHRFHCFIHFVKFNIAAEFYSSEILINSLQIIPSNKIVKVSD